MASGSGFGCGAHSTRGGVRWKNVSATGEYVRRVAAGEPLAAERREMTRDEQFEDALFTGLRLTEGLDLGVGRGTVRPGRLGPLRRGLAAVYRRGGCSGIPEAGCPDAARYACCQRNHAVFV